MTTRRENTVDKTDGVNGRDFAIIAVGLAAVTLAAYWNIHRANFLEWDDHIYVTGNYHVLHGISWAGTKWAFSQAYASNWHPLTWLSHMLDTTLFGKGPAGPHIVNLAFHVANTLLLLWLLVYATGRLWASAFVAALFALHPLHVESVAWVAERKDVLSTFFWILSMLAWVRYSKRPVVGFYLLALLLAALGLMSKSMLVTLPLVLLLMDYWPLERSKNGVSTVRMVLEKVPLACLSLASVVVTLWAQELSINDEATMAVGQKFTNAIVSFWRYAHMMFWPENLSIYYPHPHRVMLVESILVGAGMAALTLLAVRIRRRYPYVLFGWLWYVITLIPVIGIVQVGDQSHADRYTYMTLTGLFIIIAWASSDIIGRFPWTRPAFVAAAAISLVVLALLTRQTAARWQSSLPLFERAQAISPGNGKILNMLGSLLVDSGRVDEGMVYLEEATRSLGHDGSAYNALGSVYLSKGDIEKARMYFMEAAKYDWINIKAEHCLGIISLDQKQYAEAVNHFSKVVQLDPLHIDAHSLLGVALSETGKLDEAVAECNKAVALDPNNAMAFYGRGYVLSKVGDFKGAEEAYRRSIAIVPTYTTLSGLGYVLMRLGRPEEALECYKGAIAIEPEQVDAYFSIGQILERLSRPQEAAEVFRRLLQAHPDNIEARAAYERLIGSK